MILTLVVGLAAAVGALARYALDQFVRSRHDSVFPWGTFAVNVTGSLLLGIVTGLALRHGMPDTLAVVLSAGFAGGYTTWSTWVWETLALAETGALLEASANVVGSLAAGLLVAAAGFGVAAVLT
ncbi:MAG TPA: fluoride efflux transporter CrcB [Mycobacteriales bacterium]|nr:fluoride efflux transporter CrcB [Mycobacteriales bacterium]